MAAAVGARHFPNLIMSPCACDVQVHLAAVSECRIVARSSYKMLRRNATCAEQKEWQPCLARTDLCLTQVHTTAAVVNEEIRQALEQSSSRHEGFVAGDREPEVPSKTCRILSNTST